MFTTATILLAGLIAFQTVSAMVINNSDPCHAILRKDVHLVGTSECDKFISCHKDGEGHMYGETISCAFGTYCSDDDLVCVMYNETKCLNDKCAGLPDGTILPAEDNCRGYWICGAGRALPQCCSHGQTFNNETEPCVQAAEGECNHTCFLDMSTAGNSTDNETTVSTCAFFPVDGEPTKYQQIVAGHGAVIQSCGAGTIFSTASCLCVADPSYEAAPICKPEVHLTFTDNAQDVSGRGYWVENNNVVVGNGSASFNGYDSYLSIPRFTSLPQASTFIVRMRYRSLSIDDVADMAIIFNGYNCHTDSSILMIEDVQDIVFYAKTAMNNEVRVTKFQSNEIDGMKEVTYKLHGDQLKGMNGELNDTSPTSGYLVNTYCDLTIGQAPGAAPFWGVIDEMAFYLCDPAEN